MHQPKLSSLVVSRITSLMRPILEYGAACRDSYRKGQINALDRVQNIAAKFAQHRNGSNWETLTQRRKIARICAAFKAVHGKTCLEGYRSWVANLFSSRAKFQK
jgi:hypothetical protein